jgi:ferredoxin-NADP reductase
MSVDNKPDWQPGRVVSSEPVARDVRRITIARPPRGRAKPGTHLDVRVPLAGGEDTRSYSIVESSPDGGLLTISVLAVPRSRGGSAYMHTLREGDQVRVTQPLQSFPLRVGAPRYVLVAGGIGVTALVETGRVLETLGADVTFVYVGRSRERMAYLEELSERHGDRLTVHVDDEGTALDVSALVESVGSHAAGRSTELYMCGPIRLMDAIRRSWASTGLPVVNLRYETFGSSGWFRPEEFDVRVPGLGLTATVGTGETMLEALARSGADLMYDCRKGECGLCRVDIDEVDGRVDHRDVFFSATQQETDRALCMCVSRVVARDGSDARPSITLALP